MISKRTQEWILFTVLTLPFIASLVLLSPSRVNALSPSSDHRDSEFIKPSSQVAREKVRVGVYILRILNFDNSNGTYQVEFYLNFECETPGCDPTQFDITNATSKPEITSIGSEYDTTYGYFTYFVRANMQTAVDVHAFPFDVQKLRIEIEDKNKDDSRYIFLPKANLSEMDPQVKIANWTALPIIDAYEEKHKFYAFDTTYSRAVFEVQAYNSIWDSLLRTILPVIVLTFGGILSFFTKLDRVADRLGIATSSLVASVMFSRNFPNGTTYMSSFMLANYLILVLGLATTIRLMGLVNTNKLDQAKKLQAITDKMFPVIWLIVQIGFIYYGLQNFGVQGHLK